MLDTGDGWDDHTAHHVFHDDVALVKEGIEDGKRGALDKHPRFSPITVTPGDNDIVVLGRNEANVVEDLSDTTRNIKDLHTSSIKHQKQAVTFTGPHQEGAALVLDTVDGDNQAL
jgi:hypothetical protein